jgi:hypothetical protein
MDSHRTCWRNNLQETHMIIADNVGSWLVCGAAGRGGGGGGGGGVGW